MDAYEIRLSSCFESPAFALQLFKGDELIHERLEFSAEEMADAFGDFFKACTRMVEPDDTITLNMSCVIK